MDKKYQVFISSTYLDLIPEREKARDVILSMYHFPIGMEMFSAADEEQWEIIKETIDSSDYYVLIIGKRYGSTIPNDKPDAGISYTEKEYRYALSQGIPILTFIKKDSAVTADKIETDPANAAKLQALIEEIKSSREADWFENVDELGTKITLALYKQFNRQKRPGWVRGDRIDVDASLNEIVQLNQQVRELAEENKQLKASIEQRKPILRISLQYVGTIGTPLEVEEADEAEPGDKDIEKLFPASETVYRIPVPRKEDLVVPSPININDVPEKYRSLSQTAIEAYNAQLPDANVIEKYYQDRYNYDDLQKNGQLLNFVLLNDGTAKATDINITIIFPKSFIILNRSDAERTPEPRPPVFHDNPLSVAIIGGYWGNTLHNGTVMAKPVYDSPYPKQLDAILDRTIDHPHITIKGKTATFWCKDLLHTYAVTFDGLCFIPTEKGRFTISVTIMCEEYSHPEEHELVIVVE